MTARRPIPIAVALPHLRPGGAEKVALALLNGLDRRYFMPSLVLLDRSGVLLDDIRPDVAVEVVGKRAALAPLALAKLFARRRFALVYSATNAMNLATVAAARLVVPESRPRIVISEHTTPMEYLSEAKAPHLRRALIRQMYPFADCLVAPLKELACEWIDVLRLNSLEPVGCRNPIIDRAALDRLRNRPPQRERDHVVAAGRLVFAKGHDLLIDAFAEIARHRTAARLTIWGEGPERESLLARAARCGLADRVRLPGHSSDLMTELARGAVFAQPSRREGFGNVVVEALAAGTPVVATECTGPAAILGFGRFGVLVPRDDPGALASALAECLDESDLRTARTEAQATRALEYTVERAVSEYEVVFDRIISRATPSFQHHAV